MASIFRAGFVAVMVTGFGLFLTLWIRSAKVSDVLCLGRGTVVAVVQGHARWARTYRLASGDGRLVLVQDNAYPERILDRDVRWSSGIVSPDWLQYSRVPFFGGDPPTRQWQFLGFEWNEYLVALPPSSYHPISGYAPRNPAGQLIVIYGRSWIIPYWAMVIPTGIAIAIQVRRAIIRHRERRRTKRGQCVTCGYDLRASKERCPECGTAIGADSAAGGEPKAV